jgi:hypothetical protein
MLNATRTDAPTMSSATRRVGYPGELGLPPTGVSFEVPAGWETSHVPGAMAVVRDPQPGASGFHANLVVSVDRVAPDMTLSQTALDVLDDSRATTVSLQLVDETVLEVRDAPAILREQVISVQQLAVPLVQFVLLAVLDVADGAIRDCLQLTLSAEAAQRDALHDHVETLLRTLIVSA